MPQLVARDTDSKPEKSPVVPVPWEHSYGSYQEERKACFSIYFSDFTQNGVNVEKVQGQLGMPMGRACATTRGHLVIFPSMSTTWLLPGLCSINGLKRTEHQVLQLQGLQQVCVPDHSWGHKSHPWEMAKMRLSHRWMGILHPNHVQSLGTAHLCRTSWDVLVPRRAGWFSHSPPVTHCPHGTLRHDSASTVTQNIIGTSNKEAISKLLHLQIFLLCISFSVKYLCKLSRKTRKFRLVVTLNFKMKLCEILSQQLSNVLYRVIN